MYAWCNRIFMEALLRPYRNDLSHLASTCGIFVSVSIRNELGRPDCHWHHAVAMRTVLEIIVSVLQCFMNNAIWPSPCKTFHGIMPHPPYDFGQKRIDFAVFRLNPCFARISGRDLVSAWSRIRGEKKHCGRTYFKLAQYTAW